MAVFKCKMCGGIIEFEQGSSVGVCDSCGTKQTLPKLDDDKKSALYDRANHFRRNNEFDKAMGIYEQILNEDNTDAEAYWSLVLCRYGIEYVEDPTTHKRVPTVNRAQYTSVYDDDNYKSALQYADDYQREIYEEEAKAINEIQKGILAISQKEEPFDVFICYKETDTSGRRTQDSVLANDLYHQLTQEGFKVFFSRITLEDKLGTAYEPYIFAALNSAKVMVVLGTKPEYFNAVWVKNEWSRFLALVKQSGGKKILIPAYRDMDPYDLPEEFAHLQAQDMSKLGFMQDLIRGIKKIASIDEPKVVAKENTDVMSNVSVAPLIKRANIFLENSNWNEADEYCEKVLDIDPINAEAYLIKLLVINKLNKFSELENLRKDFSNDVNYKNLIKFADSETKKQIELYLDKAIENQKYDIEQDRIKKEREQEFAEEQHRQYVEQLLREEKERNAILLKKLSKTLKNIKPIFFGSFGIAFAKTLEMIIKRYGDGPDLLILFYSLITFFILLIFYIKNSKDIIKLKGIPFKKLLELSDIIVFAIPVVSGIMSGTIICVLRVNSDFFYYSSTIVGVISAIVSSAINKIRCNENWIDNKK